jgi:hypothetical protein
MSTLTQQKPDIGAVCSEPSKASTLSKQPEKYRLNHAAAEFISSDSSASSMISEKSEGEEEFVGATVAVPQPDKEEGGRVSQQQGHAEGGASSAAGPRRRALGWESPQVRWLFWRVFVADTTNDVSVTYVGYLTNGTSSSSPIWAYELWAVCHHDAPSW